MLVIVQQDLYVHERILVEAIDFDRFQFSVQVIGKQRGKNLALETIETW